MKSISIDLETRSSVDIGKSGVYRYAEAEDFAILLFGYSVDGGTVQVIDLVGGEQIPKEILDALTDDNIIKWAFNANFERVCLSRYLSDFGMLRTAEDARFLSPRSWRCTMVWSAYMGLPLSLAAVGRVLGLEEQKMNEGKALIRYFSTPPFHKPTGEKRELFKSYNSRDVEVEMAIQQRLSKYPVPPSVWEEYVLDQEINDRGIRLDMPLVENAVQIDALTKEKLTDRLKTLTGLENPNSVVQMKAWLKERGVETESLDKKAVAALLANVPAPLKEVLELRQQLAKSSVKKYQAMQNTVCSDEGISGTNTKKRDGFNQMIEDALAGKIDLIITKSVSRFARNTVDSLQNVRKLKEHGVEIYFEKENIWTFDTKGELLITIMSSLAQEESRSISENTTWGKRKQFAEGKTSVGYSAFLGYDKDFKINEEQAKVVKLIYKLFLGGRSFYAITKELEKRGIKSPSGKDRWYISTVRSILTNEKYRGDALIQKEYTADFLDKTRRKNTGEIPQYYVEEHHEAIIPPDLFDLVQEEIKEREKSGKHSGVSIFANKIKCGCCGGWYGAKVWHSTDKYRRVIYRCNKKYAHKGKPCSTRHLTEEEIKQTFVKALNSLVEVKENVIAELQSLIDDVCQMVELTEERDRIEQELGVLAERLETLIRENARVAQDQNAYLNQENEIRALYVEKQGHLARLDEQIAKRESKRNTLEGMIQVVCGIDGEQVAFDEELWGGLLDHIVVKEDGQITVVFKGGIEMGVGR